MDDHDVEPRNVVGDEQAAARSRYALDAQFDADQAQHLRRPPADLLVSPLDRQGRKAQQGDEHAVQPMQHATRQSHDGAKTAHPTDAAAP